MNRPILRASLARTTAGWYRITNRANTTDVLIYDEIGEWGVTASDFVKDLQAITAGTIELHVNSPGGNVFDGIAIYNALRNHPATVNVTVDGLAASAASFIVQAGDTRTVERTAQMMIHDAHGVAIGPADTMREMADLLDKASDNIASIYADRTDKTVPEWREAMRNEVWYSADEAVESGLADRIAGVDNHVRPAIQNEVSADWWDPTMFKRAVEEAVQ